MMISFLDLLKLHLFLFYASVSCLAIFIVVYYKTYTVASYDEIGTLIMFCCLASAIMKPVVCSIADRHNNYKQCLMVAQAIMLISNLAQIILPFYPQLLFDEPHPRLVWYLLATSNLFGVSSVGVSITLTDVFVVHKCLNATTGEHFGQYRVYGVFGWGSCSIGLALMEHYLPYNLPSLILPMAAIPVLVALDLVLIYNLKDIKRRDKRSSLVSTINDEYLNMAGQQVKTLYQKPLPPILEPNPPPLKKTLMPKRGSSIRSSISQQGSSLQERDDNYYRIGLLEQLDLLIRLDYYDNFNLIKYLLLLTLMGTLTQVHYLFYLQFMSETLSERGLLMVLFTFSAVMQVSSCTGESLGLLFISRLVQSLGRDVTIMLCLGISGFRYAVAGFLVDYLNVWVLALIDVQTGILFGINYTLMTETSACYLSILDKLLLVDTESSSSKEVEFITYLEQMKDIHSIESIRFALKATIQSLFSGSHEGIGYALSALLSGVWLNLRGNSIQILYQDLVVAHLVVLGTSALIEFGIIRGIFDARSRVDKLRIR